MGVVELTHVHLQRLRGAVEASRAGGEIRFVVLRTEPPTIAWRDLNKPRVQHTIMNAFGSAKQRLRLVEMKYQEMLECSETPSA